MRYDLIIIGGGPAGLTAALYAKRAGLSTLLLEGGSLGGQAATTPDIENWPGTPHIAGADFAMALYGQTKALGADIRFEAATGLVDRGQVKQITTGTGSYEGRTVILANGVRRRKLEVPGEERLAGRGVSYCATCDGNFFRGRAVAVVGGGNTALEDAIYLAALCPSVHLIHRRSAFTGDKHLVDGAADLKNLHISLDTRVQEVVGQDKVEGLRVSGPKGERTLPVAGVFVAVGLIPDNGVFSPPLELDAHGYMRSDCNCHTNLPGVFAAGDTRSKELRQLVTAAADGATAAFQVGLYLHGG